MTATYLLIMLGVALVAVFLILAAYGLDVMRVNPESADHVRSQGSPALRDAHVGGRDAHVGRVMQGSPA